MRSREVLSRKAHDTVLPGLSIDKAGNSRAAEHSLCVVKLVACQGNHRESLFDDVSTVGRRQRTERK